MHELSIAQRILESIQQEKELRQWGPVASVALRIGALAGVHQDSLLFGFEALRSEFGLADCALVMERIPLTLHCPQCGQDSTTAQLEFSCQVCGSPQATVIGGYELDIVSVEVGETTT